MSVHGRRATPGPSTRAIKILVAGAVALSAVTVGVLVRPSGSDAQVRPVDAAGTTSPLAQRVDKPGAQRSAATKPAAVAAAPAALPAAKSPKSPPVVNPCRDNAESKQVLVSLADQHMWLCARHHVNADYPITTGRSGEATPTGKYEVQALTRNTTLNPDSGGSYRVRYWIPFKWGMFGFHDAPWQKIPFGSSRYRTAGSQGCVHMRTADIAHLFGWVSMGTTVRVVAGSQA